MASSSSNFHFLSIIFCFLFYVLQRKIALSQCHVNRHLNHCESVQWNFVYRDCRGTNNFHNWSSYKRSSLIFHSLVTFRSYNRSARSDKWIQLAKSSFNRTVTESLVETNGFHINGAPMCFYYFIFSLFSLDLVFVRTLWQKMMILKVLKIRSPSTITDYVSLILELSKRSEFITFHRCFTYHICVFLVKYINRSLCSFCFLLRILV